MATIDLIVLGILKKEPMSAYGTLESVTSPFNPTRSI